MHAGANLWKNRFLNLQAPQFSEMERAPLQARATPNGKKRLKNTLVSAWLVTTTAKKVQKRV